MGFGSRFSSLRDLVLGIDFLLIVMRVMRVNNWNYDLLNITVQMVLPEGVKILVSMESKSF